MPENASATAASQPPALQTALDWLNAPLSGDPLDDAPALRQHLRLILGLGVIPLQRLKLLDTFQQRAAAISRKGRSVLSAATLPMPRQLRMLARALIESEGALVDGFLGVANDSTKVELAAIRSSRAQLYRSALIHLAEQQEIAFLTSSSVPAGLWTRLQSLYHLAHDVSLDPPATAKDVAAMDRLLKGMLALAAAQPEGYTPAQIDFLVRFLQQHCAQVEMDSTLPLEPAGWYWLERSRDLPPVAAARRQPPRDGACLYFRCTALGHNASEIISRWSATGEPDSNEVPVADPQANCLGVLRQAAHCWSAPPKRLRSRRRNNYAVKICVDLLALWRLLNGELDEKDEVFVAGSSDWTVVNESPGGYAVIHAAGEVSGVQSGGAVGLRMADDQPWNICLVRWARSDNPEHIELGLELVAPQARAVRLALGGVGAQVLPALLLPPLAQLQRGESLLAARGTYSNESFTLIQDLGERVRISHCLAQGLWLQTSSIEVYEFERDPLPL
jgi:hypothetical protein